jgi:uncharacterized protein YbaR (Trm112 family)
VFVELLESLRCPRPHAETHLVVNATRTEARHIVEGVLGCPVCDAEFSISNGKALFTEARSTPPTEAPSAEAAMRIAAFLELTDARGFAILCGRRAAHADYIQRLAETPLVLVNPPAEAAVLAVAAVICVDDAVPFAPACARAAALDDAMPASLVQSVVRAVRPGGRVVGPASLALPAEVTELVRDDRDWVGEKTAATGVASPPISITRR